MKKKLITLTDEESNLLSKYPNQNEIIRKAIDLYIGHITTDTVEGLRTSYKNIAFLLKEIDSKLDYLAKVVPKE